jgi:hypothetical protein
VGTYSMSNTLPKSLEKELPTPEQLQFILDSSERQELKPPPFNPTLRPSVQQADPQCS